MSRSVLVLGARGRFGRASAHAFRDAGWEVHVLARGAAPGIPGTTEHRGDLRDAEALARLAEGRDLIVHAANVPYPDWAKDLPAMTRAVLAAAEASGATVLIPGNIYVFGRAMPELLGPDTPHRPDTRKGRLRAEMEAAFRDASSRGVRTVVLRAGDFLEAEASGNWFDAVLAKSLAAGRLTYPGRRDAVHAWAWLPDAARAAVGLAEIREDLPAFADVPFAGLSLTGEELRAGLAQAMGRGVTLRGFPWAFLRLGAPFNPMWREILEMRYLWDVPHRLDPAPLARLLPDYRPSSAEAVFAALVAGSASGSTTSAQTSRWEGPVATVPASAASGAGQKTPAPAMVSAASGRT